MVEPLPRITIRFIGTLRTLAGIDEVSLPLQKGDTIGSIFQRLVQQYPILDKELFDKTGQLHQFLNVFVNDKPILSENLNEIKIQNPVTLTIMMVVGGGQK